MNARAKNPLEHKRGIYIEISKKWISEEASLKGASHNPYHDAFFTLCNGAISLPLGPRIEGHRGGGFDWDMWRGEAIEERSGLGLINKVERDHLSKFLNLQQPVLPPPARDDIAHIAIDAEYFPSHEPYAFGIAILNQDDIRHVAPGQNGKQRGFNYLKYVYGFYFLKKKYAYRLEAKHKVVTFPGCPTENIFWWSTNDELHDLFSMVFQHVSKHTGRPSGPLDLPSMYTGSLSLPVRKQSQYWKRKPAAVLEKDEDPYGVP